MSKAEPTTQRTVTLKRRVGYGEYMDAEESEKMEVDKHLETRQKTNWHLVFILHAPAQIYCIWQVKLGHTRTV